MNEISRHGDAWSSEEDRQVYDAYVAGLGIEAIAQAQYRSTGAIKARIRRLGLVDENYKPVTPPPPFAPYKRTHGEKAPLVEMPILSTIEIENSINVSESDDGLFRKETIEALKAALPYDASNFDVAFLKNEELITTRLSNIAG